MSPTGTETPVPEKTDVGGKASVLISWQTGIAPLPPRMIPPTSWYVCVKQGENEVATATVHDLGARSVSVDLDEGEGYVATVVLSHKDDDPGYESGPIVASIPFSVKKGLAAAPPVPDTPPTVYQATSVAVSGARVA